MPRRKKIALIGAGNIGGELAALVARRELGDVVLFDIPEKEGFAKGKALDLEQNGAVLGYDAKITRHLQLGRLSPAPTWSSSPRACRASRACRATICLSINLKIIRNVAENVKSQVPERVRHRHLEPARRDGLRAEEGDRLRRASSVVGMAGVLDAARFQLFLAREAGVGVKDVRAMVLGGHGDNMVPVTSYCTINGVPVRAAHRGRQADAIVERTRNGGGEIVKLMGTSAYYAPASAAIAMAEAYLQRSEAPACRRRVPRRRVRLQGSVHGRAGRHRRRRRREDRQHRSSPPRRRRCSTSRRGAVRELIEASQEAVTAPAHEDPRVPGQGDLPEVRRADPQGDAACSASTRPRPRRRR